MPKTSQKTITFHSFQNTGSYIKIKFCCNPPPAKIVFDLFSLTKTIDVEQKHNCKSGKHKDKKKRFQRANKTGYQERERIDKKATFVIEYVDVVLFMKPKQRRNNNKERDKNKEPKESKKEERKKERKEEKEKEKVKKGFAKKGSGETKGDTQKLTKMPFLGGKQSFSVLKEKKGKKTQKKTIMPIFFSLTTKT